MASKSGFVEDLATVPTAFPASVLSEKFNTSTIRKIPLDLSSVTTKKKLAFLLENVFTPAECQALIQLSESSGYTPALVNIGGGLGVRMPGYRDSYRVMIDDKEFVSILLKRISSFLPKTFQGEKLVEVNERLRFLRYDPGDKFKKHYDGAYARPDNSAVTLITLQIYLNEGFEGGETTFLCDIPQKKSKSQQQQSSIFPTNQQGEGKAEERTKVSIVPKQGMILVFEHEILHEGSLLTSGRKYTIRTDVLYTYTPKRHFPIRTNSSPDEEEKSRCIAF